ncbi:MAG TPA: SHOCT domain-containing protein [Nitrospiria bacterium]
MEKNSLGLPLIIGISMVTLLACGPKVITTKIHEDPSFKVYLIQTPKNEDPLPAPPYQHPLQFDESQMEQLLGSIQIQYSKRKLSRLFSNKKPDQEPAFSEEEIKHLALPMARAFGQATPKDKIHFQLDHRVSVFRGGRSTGVLFAKNDRLHFILGNYRYIPGVKRTDIYREINDRIQKPSVGVDNPLNTKDIGNVSLTPSSFQKLHEIEEEKLNGRWLAIDYTQLLQSPSPAQEEKTPKVHLNLTLPSAPKGEPSLEERLRTLKQWREEGLISEEEYSEKKQDLLKEF